ncbi:MAG: LysR family transcriptional regulator [Anaerolineales bacterium]|nr:LysR family transcriptional regulator [Anaerolineales bacterium]
MIPRYNLWIERNGEVVLSTWRVELLRAVHQTGSITSAAEVMDVPYRRAWERIHEMEERLGVELLTTEVGGPAGGGAKLTKRGKELVKRFADFSEGMEIEIQSRFERAFGEISL